MALLEDFFDLLECASRRLGETEEDVDARREVERAEDEVRLVRDVGKTRRNRPSQSEVEQPVRR